MLKNDVKIAMQDDDLWSVVASAQENDTGFSLLAYIAKAKWEVKLNEKFGKEEEVKTHLLISGGNYTCDVILPYFLKRAKDSFPWYPIKLGLAEHGSYEDLAHMDDDIIFSGFYPGSAETFSDFKKQINKHDFETTRSFFCKDFSSIGCSEEIFQPGKEEDILKKYPLVRGRHFRDSSLTVQIPFKHRMMPTGRETDSPLIISDKFYYSYLLMRYSLGLWVTLDSAPYDRKVCVLEKIENSEADRHVIFKKGYERIGKVLAKQAGILFADLSQDKKRKESNFWL